MRILIEGHKYQTDFIEKTRCLAIWGKDGKTDLIGYFYSHDYKDCVFILPKVILNEDGKIFDSYSPEDIWNVKLFSKDSTLRREQHDFLFRFSIWIYQSINVYNRQNRNNGIVQEKAILDIDTSTKNARVSFLDILLALVRFSDDNRNFLLFKMSNMHNQSGKVNWQRTVSHRQPVISRKKVPIYLHPIIKRKDIDYEEELLVIYFSILHYIDVKYGFKTQINTNFDLIKDKEFESYLNGAGLVRLQSIKYKYFSDTTLKIWSLCNYFFMQTGEINSSHYSKDFLLTSTYNKVFEAMVDFLIGDPQEDLPKHISKAQKDGKEIDHLFRYISLIDSNLITFYIADSKYYKTEDVKDMKGTSLFKQFTYARNLLQDDLQWRMAHPSWGEEYFLCRDDLTEGYNIIPNYFLSAYIDSSSLSYDTDGIKPREEIHKVFHFPNRLFDRETLLLSHYDINFLFVVKQYANLYKNVKFRDNVRKKFRKDMLGYLNDNYLFFTLTLKDKPSPGNERNCLEKAITPIFRYINGKILCPSKDLSFTTLLLALENPDKIGDKTKKECVISENNLVFDLVDKVFTRKKHILGKPIV